MSCPARDCKYYPDCFTDTHHEAYPRKEYRSKLEREYRKLMTVTICRREHDDIHANQPKPRKPSAGEMRNAIQKHSRN